MEVHVRQKAVLRDVEADAHRAGVALAHIEVDVAHGGVKRARIGIHHPGLSGHCSRERHRCLAWRVGGRLRSTTACFTRASTGKQHHVRRPSLKSRGVVAQREDGPVCAIADHPHPRPHIQRARDAIPALRHKDDALPRRIRHRVDGFLQPGSVVRNAIAFQGEAVTGGIHG